MSKTAQADDIDELVSSVRNFVALKEPHRTRSRILLDRLVLLPEQRVQDGDAQRTPVNVGDAMELDTSAVRALPPVQSFDKAGLEATIAELEAAVTAQFDDWEPDEGESFATAAWAASAFQTPQADSGKVAQLPATKETSVTDAGAEQSHLLEAARAEREPAFAHQSTEPEPAADESRLTASVMGGMDEDALRILVAEIVQDELGGELGERITRNVRKLVRREINRVLASREMGED